MIHWFIGGSGTGKSTEILKIAENKINNGISPLMLIPDQFSFEFDKKLYNILKAEKYNKAETSSFSRLAETIFLKYGGKSGEYADDLTKSAVIYQAVEEAKSQKLLKFFTKQAEKDNFCESILQVINELKKSGTSPTEFYEKLCSVENQIKYKAEDISVIFTLYDNILEKNNLKDKLDNISEAASIAIQNRYFDGMTVFIDEFESFPDNELSMLEAIISQSADVYITLRADSIDAKSILFKSANATYFKLKNIADKHNIKSETNLFKNQYRFKSEALKYISSNIFRCKAIKPINNSDGLKIIETRDFYQESEYICSEICRLVRDENYKFSDFSIITRNPDDYTGILEASFKRYHIPYFMDVEKSVMHTSIMVLVSGMLEMISSKKPNTETILKYAKTQLLDLNYEHISILENYCYKWNVNGNVWNSTFNAESGGSSKDKKNEEIAENLRKQIIDPLNALRIKCTGVSGLQICTAIYEYFEEMNIPSNVSSLSDEYMDSGYEYMAKELKRLWGCLMDILDTAANILHDTEISPENFRGLINSMLKQNKYSDPPHFVDAVSVSTAQRARFDEPRAVFIIGVNEGFFPIVKLPESLINENDKLIMKKNNVEFSKPLTTLISDEKFMFYKSVSAPSERLYITYPNADASGNARFVSSAATSILSMFDESQKNDILCHCTDFDDIFYSPTAESAYYNFVQYFNKHSSEQINDIRYTLDKMPKYKEKIKYLTDVYNKKDFNIEKTDLIKKTLSEKFAVSATSFEMYNKCHFEFFCKHIIKVKELQKKDISPSETGSIVHKCLENVFRSCSSKDEFTSLKPNDIRSIITDTLTEYRNDNLGGDFAKSKRFEVNYSKIKNTAYEIIDHIQEELAQSEFRPAEYELEIVENSQNKPMKIVTPSGIEVILNGKVDRVDIYEEDGKKYIRIIDYKSKNKVFALENLYYGIDMQMFLYLYSIISGNENYQGSQPAGVLYLPYTKTECDTDNGKDIEEKKRKAHQMNGLILENNSVLAAMEKDLKYAYIPASSKKIPHFTEQQFENLETYIKKSISDMTESLYSGDISANPLDDACKYCEYTSICGNNQAKRKIDKKNDKEKLMEIINEISETKE